MIDLTKNTKTSKTHWLVKTFGKWNSDQINEYGELNNLYFLFQIKLPSLLGAPKQPVDQKPLQFDQDGAPVFPPSRPNTQPATSQAQGQIRNNPDVQVTGAVTKTSNNNANIPKVNFFLKSVQWLVFKYCRDL